MSFYTLIIYILHGVVKWLERRCLVGGLSLIYAWSMADMGPLRGHWSARYESTNQANSAFHPFGVGKWVVIIVITWITGVETINGTPWLRIARAQAYLTACGLYARSVCETKAPLQL